MKRFALMIAVILAAILLSGCCCTPPNGCGPLQRGPNGCGPAPCGPLSCAPQVYRTCPQYCGRVSVPHPLPQRSLFTETQIPLVDCQGQCRLMGEAKFKRWVCDPPPKLEPTPVPE